MKFCGKIGYSNYIEQSPGVWVSEETIEKQYTGNFVKRYINDKPSNELNNNIDISFTINLIPDKFLLENFHKIAYLVWRKSKWRITSVDVTTMPRITITVGGVYNE